MADNLRKYTTQEVLNKVYTDSSGITIGLNSQTSKETLNAVLDSSNNRLQVAMAGGTISGDVTINGDLTVNGDGSGNYDEIINGNLEISSNGVQLVGNLNYSFLTHHSSMSRGIALGHDGGAAAGFISSYGASNDLIFAIHDGSNYGERMRLTSDGQFKINVPNTNNKGLQIGDNASIIWGNPELQYNVGSGQAHRFNVDGSEKMRLNADGLGIGTDSPDSDNLLHIKNTSGDKRGIIIENTVTTSYAEIHLKGAKEYRIGTGGSSTSPANRFYIYDAGANAHRFDIDTNGNVGIGTTAPGDYNSVANKLVIANTSGNSGITIASGTSGYGALYFADGTSGTAEYMGGVEYNHSTNVMKIWANGSTVGLTLDADSKISLSNNDSGTSNTVFGKNIGVHSGIDAGTNYNVFIGEDVASDNALSDATHNVVIGYQAGEDLTTADNCVFIGYQAGQQHSQSSGCTAIGYRAMYNSSGLDNWGNTFFGFGAAAGNWTTSASNGNVGVGYQVLHGALNDADYNVAVGYQAGYSMTEGSYNSLLGYKAGVNLTEGSNNVAIGNGALLGGVTNFQNVAIGGDSLAATTSDSNTAVGEKSGNSNTSGTFNTVVGRASFYYNQTGSNNTAIGYQAQYGVSSNSHSNNTSVGYRSMFGITTGTENVAVGNSSLLDITTGNYNTMLGVSAGENSTTGSYNTAVGYQAMHGNDSTAQTGDQSNVAMGYQAMYAVTTATNCVALGANALDALTAGDANIAIGRNALGAANSSEEYNIAIGRESMSNLNGTYSDYNIAIGGQTLQSGSVAAGANIAIGHQVMTDIDAVGGDYNVAIGHQSMNGTWETTGSRNNTAIGALTMQGAMNDADDNTAVGYEALKALTQGDKNTAIGKGSLDSLTTGSQNTALGRTSLPALTTGGNNVGIGMDAGLLTTEGNHNIFIGTEAGNSNTTGDELICIGYRAGYSINHASDADGTVAIGYQAGSAVTSGGGNTLIGYQSGDVLTTGANNVIIGYDADVDANDRDGCIVIGKGLSLNTASDNVVEIGNNTNSMTYDLDGGDITVTSDVRTKKDIKDTKLGLEFVNKLRPITYKTKPSSEYPKEFGVKEPSKKSSGKTWDGLIAQEVKEVMDEMNVEFSGWEEGINTKQRLAYGKFVMPLIKAVQELSAKVDELEGKLSK